MTTTEKNGGGRYRHVPVQLIGTDGNAFAILGKVQRELRRAGAPQEDIDAFVAEATEGDYDQLLGTAMGWVDVR